VAKRFNEFQYTMGVKIGIKNKKDLKAKCLKALNLLVGHAGFEPATS